LSYTSFQLQPGESKTIRFVLDKDRLSFYNQQLQRIAEPDMFDIMIGSASDDIRLQGSFELVK